MIQCAWVYTEGGQFGGRCTSVPVYGSDYCASHTMAAPKVREKNEQVDVTCFHKAKARGQMTFTLVEQDATAVSTVAWWILQNIETAPEDKLRLALEECLEMRKFKARKHAD